MATEVTTQVLDSAVEAAGVSIVTATRTVAFPRNGVIYNPTTFAIGVPVWFHRLHDGRYLALFSKRWVDATAVYHDGPQVFSSHTESGPCYAYIDPASGTVEGPYDWTLDTLTSAVSRGDYLFALGERDGTPFVQHFVITRFGGLQLQGSEPVPLDFKLGLYADPFHLYVYGADGDNRLARIRKNWGRIGNNNDSQMQWECEGVKGWYTDFAESVPLPGYLPADGPCSVAKFRDRFYIMTTVDTVGLRAGQAYSKRIVDQIWTPLGDPIVLGDDDTYLGGAVYLQPQLVVNKGLLAEGASTGFPYVTSVLVVVGSDQAILTEWGILSV